MLEIDKSLLLIIDVQDKLVAATKYGQDVAINTAKLAKAADILGIQTIVTEQYPKGLGNTVAQVQENLSTDTIKYEKAAFSALLEPEISSEINKLKQKGFTQIAICGIETHICVLQTASDLINQGFEVYVVKDACASRNKDEFKTGIELLKQYNAKITCVEIALFEWLKTSKNPNFKEVQALIK